MKTVNHWLLALMLALGMSVTAGCPTTGTDDDDTADDDDDDDDDDGAGEYAVTTFAGTLSVTLDAIGDDDDSAGDDDDSAGDDDDSAGDDDDSAGDDDDSASTGSSARSEATVSGTFIVRYWENLEAQLIGCQQTVSWTGTASFDFGVLAPDCNTCSGNISVDTVSVADVSDSVANPDDCNAELLATRASENWGDLLTNEEGGFAWLEMPLLDVATATSLGLEPTNGSTLADTVDGLAGNGLELTHVGFVDITANTIFGPDGFGLAAAGANPPEAGAPFGAFWTVFKDPAANPFPAGVELSGDYFLGSFWLLN